jgi:serine/threonine-protein kinase RsbW
MQILNYKIEAYVQFNEASIEELLTLCEEVADNIAAGEETRFKLKSAIHELLINALEHGYKKSSGKVSLSISKEDKNIFLEVSDEGSGLDLSMINLNRKELNIDVVSGRGWGLLITNKLCDSMKIIPNVPNGTTVSLRISE